MRSNPIITWLETLLPLIEADQIIRHACELALIEAPTDFDSFAQSAAHVQNTFEQHGAHVRHMLFTADGRSRFHSWTSPIGFYTKRATCELLEPSTRARLLGDRELEPNTAFVGTGYTGPHGVTGKVVHIRQANKTPHPDVHNKIIYCSDINPAALRQLAVSGEALGIVSSYSENKRDNYKHVRWINAWDSLTDGWLPTATAAEQNLPGISISPKAGDYLENCLASEEVTLRIITEGQYSKSALSGVFATIEGQTPEKVVLTGHLFEQGLTDNALGASIAIEISNIVQKLTSAQGTQPVRSLINFHSQECYGILALSQQHPELVANTVAHLNIDMIGVQTPAVHVMPGLMATRGVCELLMRHVLDYASHYVENCAFQEGQTFDINCTLLADPLLGGIPTTQLEQLNPYWHTSHDRGDSLSIDAPTVKYVTLAAAAWTLFMLNAGEKEIQWLLHEYENEIQQNLVKGEIIDTDIYLKAKRQEMMHAVSLAPCKQQQQLSNHVNAFIEQTRNSISDPTVIIPAGSPEEVTKCQQIFPLALVGGPATDRCFSAEQLTLIGNPRWDPVQLSLKAWADGSRSIYDIARLTTYETGKPIDLKYALSFFETYAKQKLVSLADTAGDKDR